MFSHGVEYTIFYLSSLYNIFYVPHGFNVFNSSCFSHHVPLSSPTVSPSSYISVFSLCFISVSALERHWQCGDMFDHIPSVFWESFRVPVLSLPFTFALHISFSVLIHSIYSVLKKIMCCLPSLYRVSSLCRVLWLFSKLPSLVSGMCALMCDSATAMLCAPMSAISAADVA